MSYWSLVKPYWDDVRIDDKLAVFADQFAGLPIASQHLLSTHWVQSEVQNGGLAQFFGNNTGVLAPEAVAGFRALGMLETAEQLAQAMLIFDEIYPRERSGREVATPSIEVENRFAELLENEVGGFWEAADRFAMKNAQ